MGRLQEKLAKNKKAPARHKAEESYLLTTKLYCGKCGALMFGESGVSHTGKMYTYYKCAAAKKKKTCDKKAVRKQWLEDLVVNETMKLVEDDASMNAIIAKVMELQNQESTDLPIYEKQLKETEVGITNMLNAIQMGILTSSTKERLEALEEQRKELQARIAEERLAKPKMKEEFVRFWLLRFRKLDMTQPEQRQALVDTFINAIYLYDDKVLITFNYKEGTETVAFGEAVKAEKSSDMSARGAPRKTSTHCILVFLFVYTMEGARTRRRRTAPQAISPVGCCLACGSQRLGMSTVEAVNRKISRLFCFCGRGCTHLHTFCTLYKKAMNSLHCSHSVYFAAQKRESYAKSTRVSSRRSSASICRMASRIILPVIFVAAGILFSGDACGAAPAVSCR